MSRAPSLTFLQAINAPETDKVFIFLIEIHDSDSGNTIRVCNNSEDITSNGNVFVAYPFDFVFPDDDDRSAPSCKIVIDNVDQIIGFSIRHLTKSPNVRMMLVLADAPDTIEVDFPYFKFMSFNYNRLTVEGTVSIENFTSEPFPGDIFAPSTTPGVF